MVFGFEAINVVNISKLENITNVTGLADLAVNVNNDIYNGFLYFILMWVLFIILYFSFSKSQSLQDKILVKAMLSMAAVSLVSFVLRAIEITKNGVVRGLLSDFQMWVFPILTIVLATIIWATQD